MNNYWINPKSATLNETYDATISSSTELTLNANTVAVEVTAIDKGAFLKWDATASSTDYDEFIAPNTTRQYVVPDGTTTVNVIEESATCKISIIEK